MKIADSARAGGSRAPQYRYRSFTHAPGALLCAKLCAGFSKLYLKLENLQPIGSFKIRGAANVMLAVTPRDQLAALAY